MDYIRTKEATDFPEKEELIIKIIRFILFFIPEANPSYKKKMHLVKEWLIEFESDGTPNREIGVSENGTPVLAGPTSKDYGFWLDTNMVYSDFKEEKINKEIFESKWNEFNNGVK